MFRIVRLLEMSDHFTPQNSIALIKEIFTQTETFSTMDSSEAPSAIVYCKLFYFYFQIQRTYFTHCILYATALMMMIVFVSGVCTFSMHTYNFFEYWDS